MDNRELAYLLDFAEKNNLKDKHVALVTDMWNKEINKSYE